MCISVGYKYVSNSDKICINDVKKTYQNMAKRVSASFKTVSKTTKYVSASGPVSKYISAPGKSCVKVSQNMYQNCLRICINVWSDFKICVSVG